MRQQTVTRAHVCLVGFWTLGWYLVNREVPEPYLDEIFHIPQTQQYCARKYEQWDPAITTPAGLYLYASTVARLLHLPCTPTVLRSTLTFVAAFPLPALLEHAIYATAQHEPLTASEYRLQGLTLSIFPIVTFFSLLFYTDVPSVIAILGAYVAMMNGRHWVASLAGLSSLLFRQTNVIWCAFIASQALLNELRRAEKQRMVQQRHRRSDLETLPGLVRSLSKYGFMRVLKLVAPYLPIPIAFGLYLVWNNGSIVLGHQQYHSASMHGAQLLYFLVFVTGISWPVVAGEGVRRATRGALRTGLGSWSRRMCSIVALAGILLLIRYQTVVHPFLLADNRHYFFYIWRRLVNRTWWTRYALAPVYLACGWLWLWRLRAASRWWLLAFVVATTLTLAPAPLVEPRYFLIPAMLLLIQVEATAPSRRRWIWAQMAWYLIVNAATIALFLSVKFEWADQDGWQRFMW